MMQGGQHQIQMNPAQMAVPQQADPAFIVPMLFKAIEDRDENLFVQNLNRLSHMAVHHLIYAVEGHGLSLIH